MNCRLQLGRYSTSLGTYVRPDGAIDYSASGSTFLYMGSFGGFQPQQIGVRMARYVIRGTVRDVQGHPIEGAALDFSGDVVYTNSAGEFFLRVKHPDRFPLKVLTEEFLFPGRWDVIAAPADVTAAEEQRVTPLQITLQPVDGTAP